MSGKPETILWTGADRLISELGEGEVIPFWPDTEISEDILDSVVRALTQMQQGRVVYRGSFAKYADEVEG